MDREYDEVISDILIQLAAFEQRREHEEARLATNNKRLDLTIKRMVKIEQRMESLEKQIERHKEDIEYFMEAQAKVNQRLLDYLKK